MKKKKTPSPTWPKYRAHEEFLSGVRKGFGSPTDPPAVQLLEAEAIRTMQLAREWETTKPINPVAAEFCYRNGWAFALAAAWLRCKLKGELLPESKTQ